MKTLRILLILSLAMSLIVLIGPAHAQDSRPDGEGDGISCQAYANGMSGSRNIFTAPYLWGGADGPFESANYTFTVTAEFGSATFRIVADPYGLTTIAGPFTTPYTVTVGAPSVAGMGLLVDSIALGPQAEGITLTVSVSCGLAGCDAQVDIPPQAVVGSMTTNTNAYFEPGNLITNPPVVLEVGKTFWVAGQDETGMYRKVLLSCQWVWVERDTIGPNFDEVWNGAPLPTTVVD